VIMLDDLLEAAREWLFDCGLLQPNDSDLLVAHLVHERFDAGWPGFLRAEPKCTEDDLAVAWLLMVRRFGLETAHLFFPQPDPTPSGDPLPILG